MSEGAHFTSEVRQRAVASVVEGMTITDVAAACRGDRKAVSRWVVKFRHGGHDGWHRKAGSGRPRKLAELTEEELRQIVLPGAMAQGFETDLWTVSRLPDGLSG